MRHNIFVCYLRKKPWIPLLFVAFVTIIALRVCDSNIFHKPSLRLLDLFCLTILVAIYIIACHKLTKIFSLRKLETAITWCQISILVAIGVWIVGVLIIFKINKDDTYFVSFTLVGTVLAWIFQDTIKGIVAFIHLRVVNDLLHIGDWIGVPKYGVDGIVTHITLTSVTFYNWDTTTSSIPTSALHSDHFINYQRMMEGKTYGRRMYKTFLFDTGWFHPMSSDDIEQIKNNKYITEYLPDEEIRPGGLNAHLFRLYLYHWLMSHPKISQQPRMIVRWLEQVESGMPLQVYAFLTDCTLPAFEWQQSQIIEHILVSLEWFGLQLYQSPSAYDVSNSNVHLTDRPAKYRKEKNNEY